MSKIIERSSPMDIRWGDEVTPAKGHFLTFYSPGHIKQLDLYHGFSLRITKETSFVQLFETGSTHPVRTIFFL